MRSYKKMYGGNANALPIEYFGGNSNNYSADFGGAPSNVSATSNGMQINEGFAGPDLHVYESFKPQSGGRRRRRRTRRRTKRNKRSRRTKSRKSRNNSRNNSRKMYGGNANALPIEYYGGNSNNYSVDFGGAPANVSATSNGMQINNGFAGPDLHVYDSFKPQSGGVRRSRITRRSRRS